MIVHVVRARDALVVSGNMWKKRISRIVPIYIACLEVAAELPGPITGQLAFLTYLRPHVPSIKMSS
jgi:peptidoglycan/LPS O-acetylase OafA/YrhL